MAKQKFSPITEATRNAITAYTGKLEQSEKDWNEFTKTLLIDMLAGIHAGDSPDQIAAILKAISGVRRKRLEQFVLKAIPHKLNKNGTFSKKQVKLVKKSAAFLSVYVSGKRKYADWDKYQRDLTSAERAKAKQAAEAEAAKAEAERPLEERQEECLKALRENMTTAIELGLTAREVLSVLEELVPAQAEQPAQAA